MDDLLRASAAALARAIRAREVSSVEIVDACLRRIEAVNPTLNAVVQLTAESARSEARRADARLARGEAAAPLHGVPMTIKDAFETAGVISTGGTTGRARFVPRQDATAVARLRAAGAIMLGKTNLPELSLAFESDNLIYGRTNNPYELTRTPGGSSGGEAAIIAAGGSPLGLGSDAAGSIRLPAHCCGIAGLKPTTGRVPCTGHFPPIEGLLEQVTAVGPLARHVEDLILTLPILCGAEWGQDWRDAAVVPVPLGDPAAVDLKALRVAFHCDNGLQQPTPEIAAALQSAALTLAGAGLVVEEARPAALERAYGLLVGVWAADGGASTDTLLREAGTTEAHPMTLKRLERIRPYAVSGAKFGDLCVELSRFRSDMLSFMRDYDLLLCPVNAYPALPHGVTWGGEEFRAFTYTAAYNLVGWPGVVVRGGTSPEGLPLGVQVVARPWREDVALAVALRLEAELGGWQPPPLR
ncbi:MAG: amidase [Candidatus Tectomicrobia bacterium]|nr:amidase [Candidatus Tectomicrobia bacterium]